MCRDRELYMNIEAEGRTFTFQDDILNLLNDVTRSVGFIDRIWVWAGGMVPRYAIRDSSSEWWDNRTSLGMTDYVIALNDHNFSNGLGIRSVYQDNQSTNRWQPICRVLEILQSKGISPHLMIFTKPNPNFVRESAEVLQEIINASSVMPRSIQLDLEGWWTARNSALRERGEEAIQQYFYDDWSGVKPELGVGITCLGGVPNRIRGALSKVDFAIPQMYASVRNYGRPIREERVQRHHSRAVEALGDKKKIIVGQTARSLYVSPRIMKNMLEIILRLSHPYTGRVREVAYWSDTHLLRNRRNRTFFRNLTNIIRTEGSLDLININNL